MLDQFGNNWIQKIRLTGIFFPNYFQIGQHVVLLHILMAEGLQSDVRDDQDCQQGQKANTVLPNVTVLISFY